MPRPRLSAEEREARRRARVAHSFSDAAYQHYDPRERGYGSTDEWIAIAEALAQGRGVYRSDGTRRTGRINPDLVTLGLDEMPADIDRLKRAFRNTLFAVHPDYGGTDAATRDAIAAYERLAKFY
jgi:hypothetical protein